jgi:5-methylcytosine-specific restriction endonuclease McrA
MHDDGNAKVCSGCGEVKPLAGFSRDSRRRDGRQGRCKTCQQSYMRSWREQHPYAGRDYYERNRERMNAAARRGRAANRDRMVFYQQRHRAGGGTAHDRGEIRTAMEYSLILADDPCAYCGGPADEIDHIVAIQTGGTAAWDNLTASCRQCNAQKATRPLLDALIRGTMLAEMENWATRWEQAA